MTGLMTPGHWEMLESIGHFSRTEKYDGKLSFPKPYSMDAEFMIGHERVRQKTGRPTSIHCTIKESGHSEGSAHYAIPGCASDGHIKKMSLIEEVPILAKEFDRVGVYPYSWRLRGWHVDNAIRELGANPDFPYWVENEEKDGDKYIYFATIHEFLNRLEMIDQCKEVF